MLQFPALSWSDSICELTVNFSNLGFFTKFLLKMPYELKNNSEYNFSLS